MFLEETPEQLALRQELRAYYAELLTDEVRRGIGEVGEGGELWREVVGRIGKDGWLGIGWPQEYGGQGRPATDQFIFFDETRRAERPVPLRDREHRRPHDHAVRHRRAEVVLPPRHPGRRGQLRHRLHRARGRHRPGLAADPGRARRRRVRRERGQGLHERRRHGRLRLAGRAHQPRRRPSTRASPSWPCRTDSPGLLLEPHRHRGRRPDHGHLLLRRPRPGAASWWGPRTRAGG